MMTGFDTYTNLLLRYPPRLIRSDEEYWQTQDVIDKLLELSDLAQEQLDYLSLLCVLTERYDTESEIEDNSLSQLRGVPLIQALLDQTDVGRSRVVSIFQTETALSNVLSGKLKPTTEQIEDLSRLFQLPHGLFFEEEISRSSEQTVQFEMPYINLEPALSVYTNGSSPSASVVEKESVFA